MASKGAICYCCGAEMIWGSDFDFEDYGYDGQGVVSTHTCSNPDCEATAEFALRTDDKEREDD